MNKFKRGDIVYFIRSGYEVIPAQVTACQGTSYILRYHGHEKGSFSGIRLEERRLFPNKEAAGAGLAPAIRRHRDTHWDPEYR